MSLYVSNYSLQPHNTFGFEARAAYAATIRSEADLLAALDDPLSQQLGVQVIGGGSNLVLCADQTACVLLMAIRGQREVAEDATSWTIEAGAGENWHEWVRATVEGGRPGLENLALVPGTVGAAPIQNIGAYGLEMAQRFESLRAFDRQRGRFVELDAEACRFGYRDSVFKHAALARYVIVSVRFRFPKRWRPELHYAELASRFGGTAGQLAPEASPRQIFDAVVEIRRAKLPDPAVIGNAGSFFKNPLVDAARFAEIRRREPDVVGYPQHDGSVKLAAGWLIDRCGWKGFVEGPVGVHGAQALVLINRGGGTGRQILALAERISASVRERFGVTLEMEPVVR